MLAAVEVDQSAVERQEGNGEFVVVDDRDLHRSAAATTTQCRYFGLRVTPSHAAGQPVDPAQREPDEHADFFDP